MQDQVIKLRSLYKPQHRYANYGDVLLSMDVKGIRGISATVNFDFPVTVIIGKNGSGKSTLSQLALCCYRYKLPGKTSRSAIDYYSLGNFFIKSNLDPNPYDADARLQYSYATAPDAEESAQISVFDYYDDFIDCPTKVNIIRKVGPKWRGYRGRPDRKCIYFGMGFFVPHHEMGDRIYLDPKTDISDLRKFSTTALKYADSILGTHYTSVNVATIQNQSRFAEMGFATRYGATYSENHMGCGEGRLIRMIDAIENAPERSLIVIEEPETALHQDAQHNLATYFLDVCIRKRHQLIITTHSPTIVNVMPPEARKKIERTNFGTVVENNPTVAEIIAHMSNGNQKTLLIYVEDRFSKKLLIEVLRKFEPGLLKAASIAEVGDKEEVLHAVRYTSKHQDIRTIGIRDEAHTGNCSEKIYAYPSNNAPEQEILSDKNVQDFLQAQYNITVSEILRTVKDHHDYMETIASSSDVGVETIEVQCIQKYIENQDRKKFEDLLCGLRKALG